MLPEDIVEIRRHAYILAEKYEKIFGGCAQCVVGALKDSIGGISNDVFKAATGLAGGCGLLGKTCGAFTGGVLALSLYLGRDYENFADPARVRFKTFDFVKTFHGYFLEEFGTSTCYEIQKKLMGRSYNLRDEDEYNQFLKAGGHEDKCPKVCGFAAASVIDILNGAGLLGDL